jgi:hypothetical protein
MLIRKSRFLALCSVTSALAILAVACPTLADVSISFAHHPPVVPLVSEDTIYYSANLPSPGPSIIGYTVYMKDWGFNEPNQASDPGNLVTVTSSTGSAPGTGSTGMGCPNTIWDPYTYVNDGVWIAYEVRGVPSNGGQAIIGYTGWYCYHPGS